ncbi:NIPSNAP family protein [Microbacterium lacticum]|uniref:NIPSNAP family protein n=1 Tax=Microbacterium lacticum TaxID=33885 RepID=UPI0028D4BD85|nr:NIPSNAP family protein [Microbacterium lacticum]
MITCVVTYTIDPAKTREFEAFARAWMDLVGRHGGVHHGYFLPSEGASDEALALFSFPSLADYEVYRSRFGVDPEFVEADRIRDASGARRPGSAAETGIRAWMNLWRMPVSCAPARARAARASAP